MTDSLSELLADLPTAVPDAARSDRLRSRCHTVLAKHRPRSSERRTVRRFWEPVVVGMGGVYFAGVIRDALQVYGMW